MSACSSSVRRRGRPHQATASMPSGSGSNTAASGSRRGDRSGQRQAAALAHDVDLAAGLPRSTVLGPVRSRPPFSARPGSRSPIVGWCLTQLRCSRTRALPPGPKITLPVSSSPIRPDRPRSNGSKSASARSNATLSPAGLSQPRWTASITLPGCGTGRLDCDNPLAVVDLHASGGIYLLLSTRRAGPR